MTRRAPERERVIGMALGMDFSHTPVRAWGREKSSNFFVYTIGFYSQVRGDSGYAGLGETLVEFMAADDSAASEPHGERSVLGGVIEDLDDAIRGRCEVAADVVKPIPHCELVLAARSSDRAPRVRHSGRVIRSRPTSNCMGRTVWRGLGNSGQRAHGLR